MPTTIRCEDVLGSLDEVGKKYAPDALYVEGNLELLQRAPRVSIVGSRKASEIGLRRASRLAGLLVEHQVIVVSGLALGIDRAAHVSAMKWGGNTIAVLATPLDRAYPKEHADLQAEIAHSHLLVTQFGPGATIGKWSFPARNRTMALLTHATVIVEAGDSSGTLHQGWEAIRLGRPLFFMQSVLDDASLTWPRKMIEYGARPLASVTELLEEIPSTNVIAQGLDDL